MKQLIVRNADIATPTLRVPEGTYKHLYLVLEGISDTADDIDLAELGRISLTRNGRPIIGNVEWANIAHFANLFGGKVEFETPTAGATLAVAPIFCYEPTRPGNVLHVSDNDNVVFSVNWGAGFTDDLASGTISVCADLADGVMDYMFLYDQHDFPLAAAGVVKERIPGENFTHLLMIGSEDKLDTALTRIQIEVDGIILHECTPFEAIAGSNFRNKIEDVGATQQLDAGAEPTCDFVAEFPIFANQRWGELLSDEMLLTFIGSGALNAAMEILVTMVDFTPPEAALTESISAAKLRAILERKRQTGRGRPVSAYRAIAQRAKRQDVIV